MLVQELMTSRVVTVAETVPVKAAAEVLVSHDITAAPVTGAAGHLVGIVSELDLIAHDVQPDVRAHLRRVDLETRSAPRVVADVMTRDVLTVPVGTDVADVVAMMVDSRVKSVPVMDGDRVVGIVSRRDVLRVLTRDDVAIEHEVRRRLSVMCGEGPVSAPVVEVSDGVVRLSGVATDYVAASARVASTVPGVVRVEVDASVTGPR